jgi:hypothetical protein
LSTHSLTGEQKARSTVEIEANENLPITWNQQKDDHGTVQINNEVITGTFGLAENLPLKK